MTQTGKTILETKSILRACCPSPRVTCIVDDDITKPSVILTRMTINDVSFAEKLCHFESFLSY